MFYIFSKESFSYISGNETFLYLWKWKPWKNFRKQNYLIFQEATFQALKMKKKTLLRTFLYFRKWNFLAPRLKPEDQIFYIFCLLFVKRELFKHKHKRKKSYTFPYKGAKFSKLKYFLIIIIKAFSSFYNIFL